jgi:uncharacterized phage-associated protein
MVHDARAVANFLLDHADSIGKKLTIMALLKIIYFAHGWHLAKFEGPLIRNAFEAWQEGPVVRVVYNCFRDAGTKSINSRATQFNPAVGRYETVSYTLGEEQAMLLRNIFGAYGHLNAFKLSDLTHEPGSPWDLVWNAPPEKITLGMRITNEAIRRHFLTSRPPSQLQ